MTNRHQLTVIGTRFPHLALGVLLAKKGRKVLIVDTLVNESGQEEDSTTGYRFRRRPAPLFGLDGQGFLRRFLDEIGIGRMLVNKTYPSNPISYQVVLPRHRVNVYPERENLFEELAREFPGRIDSFRDLYGRWDNTEKPSSGNGSRAGNGFF
jgi:phytoene dehydrogenase-like protein